jgi:hypothetical protein
MDTNTLRPASHRLIVLMIDPEGRGGAGVNHWVAYGISPSVAGFAEGEVSKPSDKYVGGKSTQGVAFYSGPCTPPNQMAHHYNVISTYYAPFWGDKAKPPVAHGWRLCCLIAHHQTRTRAAGSGEHQSRSNSQKIKTITTTMCPNLFQSPHANHPCQIIHYIRPDRHRPCAN